MAIQNRSITLPAIWANDAQTEIPSPPVAGVSYRNQALSSTAIEKAWAYKEIVDSANFNQHSYLQDTLIQEAEQYGVMRWNNATSYKKGGFCLAQDEKLYQAISDNKGKEPTSNADVWEVYPALSTYQLQSNLSQTIDSSTTKYPSNNAVKTYTDKTVYNKISNCLTEIPQDIKLELADGTLTLKAGSKVYFGDGSSYTTTADSSDISGGIGKEMIVYLKNSKNIADMNILQCISSETQPVVTNYCVWYDTVNKILKFTINNFSTWEECSFPLCVSTYTNHVPTSIDQVFNGFGYIGNTLFALPGVKGLIPNGFNTDGSLNSIERTPSSIAIKTLSGATTNGALITNLSGTIESTVWYSPQAQDYPDSYVGRYYNYAENYIKLNFTGKWAYQAGFMLCAYYTADSTGRITSLTPNTAFHATDYSEYAHEVGRCAKLDESNTFTGVNSFTNILSSSGVIEIKSAYNKYKGFIYQSPSSGTFWLGNRKEDTSVFLSNLNFYTSGKVEISINREASERFFQFPTPNIDATGNKGVTADWVNSKFKVVSTLPAEPDANVFYFIPEVI